MTSKQRKIFELARSGSSAEAIMNETGIKSLKMLQAHAALIMVETKDVLDIPGLVGERKPKILSQSGIHIALDNLNGKFEVNTAFDLDVTDEKIVLIPRGGNPGNQN